MVLLGGLAFRVSSEHAHHYSSFIGQYANGLQGLSWWNVFVLYHYVCKRPWLSTRTIVMCLVSLHLCLNLWIHSYEFVINLLLSIMYLASRPGLWIHTCASVCTCAWQHISKIAHQVSANLFIMFHGHALLFGHCLWLAVLGLFLSKNDYFWQKINVLVNFPKSSHRIFLV